MQASTILERAAEFVVNLGFDDVPEAVVTKAKVTLLHDLSVALAGYDPGEPALELAKKLAPSSEGARVIVDGARVALEAAVVPNGAIIHARTQDDSQISAQSHLGCTTLPALLALGDQHGADGRTFLSAMIAGYEVSTAIGRGVCKAATERGFRPTSILGAFGAAAACGKLLGLDRDQLVSALALCASFGGGVNQTWVSGGDEWRYQVGVASRNGLTAALLASAGVRGAADALEGESGFYRAFMGPGLDAADAVAQLGGYWNTLDVSYKAHPVCALNQSPVDLAIALHRDGVRASQITALTVRMAPHQARYPGTDNPGPFKGASDALMSAQFCIAVGLARGGIRLDDLTGPLSPEETRLVELISVVPDESVSENCVVLEVDTESIRVRRSFDAQADARDWGEVEAVAFLERLQPELPVDRTAALRLQAACLGLEGGSVRELLDATVV